MEFEGAIVVSRSKDPEFDLARVLLARGITGSVTILDGKTRKPRILIRDIAKAAEFCTEEGPNGPRFVKRRQTRVDRSPAVEKPPSRTMIPGAARATAPGFHQRSPQESSRPHGGIIGRC